MKRFSLTPGLREKKEDKRDLSLGALFDQPKVEALPDEFELDDPFPILDQGQTDFCTAFATVGASQMQERVALDPLFQMSRIKKIMGDWKPWGAEIRSAMKAGVKIGFLEADLAPFRITETRDFLADWGNWPTGLEAKSIDHSKDAYFQVDGRYDLFDNIRTRIWQFREQKRAIVVGALWRESWALAMNGFIPENYESNGSGHCFFIVGWRRPAQNTIALKIKNSFGAGYGDKGYFYMTRKVANKEIPTYGAFMFKDLPIGETRQSAIEKSQEYKWAQLTFPQKFWSLLKDLF